MTDKPNAPWKVSGYTWIGGKKVDVFDGNGNRVLECVSKETAARVVHAVNNHDALVALLTRYRNETPLGHQPHMIAHEVDAAIAALDAELKKPEVHGERLPQTRTMVINDRAFEITFVENGGYYFVPKEWLPPVRDAASLTYHFTQASRKAGDASQPEQCEWKYDENGEFRSACGGAYMPDIGANPSDYMTFCYGCGKKIRFVAQEDDE